jgi:hypothetical protein
LYTLALVSVVNGARAQDFDESKLTEARLIGDPTRTTAPSVVRPQLVTRDHATPKIIGTSAAVIGGVSLVAAWTLYVARQNYRLRPWRDASQSTRDSLGTMGAWTFGFGASAAGLIVLSEYMLLPESNEVPTLAWIGGAAGLGVAAVGVGFAVGGTHCGIQVVRPGGDLVQACLSGTADGLFGPLLALSAAPLLNLPLTYLFRKAFAGAPESLSFGPASVEWKGRF